MKRFLLSALLAVSLAACAASPAKVASAAECATGTLADIKAKANEAGAEQAADLTGEKAAAFMAWVNPHLEHTFEGADEVLIFRKGGAALIIFFHQGCALGHAVGPWPAVQEFLGQGV